MDHRVGGARAGRPLRGVIAVRGMRRVGLRLTAACIAVGVPAKGAGQQVEALTTQCVQAGAAAQRCAELAVTARALQAQVGLLSGLGSEVSGSAGTLGRRLGRTPRVAFGARAAFARLALPDLNDAGTEPSRESSFIVPAVDANLVVGLFDGFSPLPTVGGVFSLDLLIRTGVVFLPRGEGFDGRATSFTYGARLGLLRESFTLPGVALSVSRRTLGNLRYGDANGPGGGEVELDPSVTSFRATVGKDLFAIGVLAGAGWDRYSGSAAVRAAGSGTVVGGTAPDFHFSRRVVFTGASMNFLILQLSTEFGWAPGFEPPASYLAAPFDPSGSTFYGSVAFRLTI